MLGRRHKMQRLMERSNTHLQRENAMLQAGSVRANEKDILDLESPVQKVLNMLRQMQRDASLLEFYVRSCLFPSDAWTLIYYTGRRRLVLLGVLVLRGLVLRGLVLLGLVQ